MSTTVEERARFASLQFRDGAAGGAQILKGSTLREMHRIQWLNPDWKVGWASIQIRMQYCLGEDADDLGGENDRRNPGSRTVALARPVGTDARVGA